MATLSSVDSIYKVRILLLGDTGVGKSSILNWIVNSNFDTSDTNANSDSNSNFPTPSSPDNYAQNDGKGSKSNSYATGHGNESKFDETGNHGLNITMGGGGGNFASGVNFGVRVCILIISCSRIRVKNYATDCVRFKLSCGIQQSQRTDTDDCEIEMPDRR
ncbi:hypothetical protein BKA69DRAFT_1037875 [Paraphysoderma sedebokerense]|nr:hypothetical protein BKA69DRAFT_1037875 [Paraphysoderma sedebokerense]